ncbi:hypothetical protein [Parapedobacter tibetensis]|uniref:hypothetical protein n=1 Tax=Parapedobacter tibetensis TaxID=2972951 RepID=UPI00214D5C76|nr:hypothetical protein [Parapedobacter tibetensis]
MMKEVTLKVPDSKFAFFMELAKQLGIEAFVEDVEITKTQKELVRECIRKADENPERLLAWG